MTFVGWPSSIVLVTFNSSIARFGSLRSKATAARIVGSQYLWTSVSSGNVLSSSAASFSARCRIACPGQSQCRHRPHVAVRGQLHAASASARACSRLPDSTSRSAAAA